MLKFGELILAITLNLGQEFSRDCIKKKMCFRRNISKYSCFAIFFSKDFSLLKYKEKNQNQFCYFYLFQVTIFSCFDPRVAYLEKYLFSPEIHLRRPFSMLIHCHEYFDSIFKSLIYARLICEYSISFVRLKTNFGSKFCFNYTNIVITVI